jgi:hypothetical protein
MDPMEHSYTAAQQANSDARRRQEYFQNQQQAQLQVDYIKGEEEEEEEYHAPGPSNRYNGRVGMPFRTPGYQHRTPGRNPLAPRKPFAS